MSQPSSVCAPVDEEREPSASPSGEEESESVEQNLQPPHYREHKLHLYTVLPPDDEECKSQSSSASPVADEESTLQSSSAFD